MKKILFLYIIHLGFALQPIQIQACCLDNEAVLANGTAIILQSPKVDNTKTIQFIKDFYANYVFGAKNYVPAVKKHCTAKLQKQLKDNYEYDSEGYAIWNFRTGMQDLDNGLADEITVTTVPHAFLAPFITNEASGNFCKMRGTMLAQVINIRRGSV